jgi:hypothetical protein
LTTQQILSWASAHKKRTGQWPTKDSGPVAGVPGETWSAIDHALGRGNRGLHGGTSLGMLLARRRGRKHRRTRPDLTAERILALAEAYHLLFGVWPNVNTGPVGTTGDTWLALDQALRRGMRGLPGGSSLSGLLKEAGKFSSERTPYKRRTPTPYRPRKHRQA